MTLKRQPQTCRLFCWPILLASALLIPICSSLVGCNSINQLRSQSPDVDEANDDFETVVETPFVRDYVTFAGLNVVTLEGVGLVVGLDGTGGDPPPSPLRTALLDDMRRRNVKEPNMILKSPTTALVAVRAYLPPMVQKGDTFDVEVRLPPNSNATSLAGGQLLEAFLSEQAIIPGQGVKKGHVMARAKGPVLIAPGLSEEEQSPGVVRRGTILGGGVSYKDRDLAMYIRNQYRSIRNAKRISDRVGNRFFAYNEYGIREALAVAKTDQKVVLKVSPVYKDNFPRYLEVIRNIAFRETGVSKRVRIENLKRDLMIPELSERSALQLEAVGFDAVPILKTGLTSPHLEVRFHSALSLAYLGDATGLPALAQAAWEERAFRVFAFAGTAVLDEAETRLQLRELMSAHAGEDGTVYDSAETRYGAFRALWTLDKNDPFIQSTPVKGQFSLHVLETTGKPMIHLTHRMRPEVVIFGNDQRFRSPMLVRAGKVLISAPAGRNEVIVSRYSVGKEDQRTVVSTRVADVITAAVEYGATYPDIVQMLIQAKNQLNVAGRVEIDALPEAGRTYVRRSAEDDDFGDAPNSNETRIGRRNLLPNMFSNILRTSRRSSSDSERDGPSGTASLTDARSESDSESEESGFFKLPKLRLPKLR